MDDNLTQFKAYNKIARLSRDITITEKIDGTNAQIAITADGELRAGSRNRWLTPQADNFGFAKWCVDNYEELRKLGPGRFYGEWWGNGIQSGYGQDEKIFSLFHIANITGEIPNCVSIVPALYFGPFSEAAIDDTMAKLRVNGSRAAPGWKYPEGIVIYFHQNGATFKKTFKHDEEGKNV